jgi:hypothetical protein
MKIVTLAAGAAVGYVLGSRAGRETYEQIVGTVRRMSGQPDVATAPDKAAGSLSSDPTALSPTASATNPQPAAAGPRPRRRKPVSPVPGVATAPLV